MWRLWCQNLWCSQRRNTPAWLVIDHFKFALQISQDKWDTYRSNNRIPYSFHELHHSEVDCWKFLPRRSKWPNASDCIQCLSTQNTWKPNTHNPLGMWRWWCQNPMTFTWEDYCSLTCPITNKLIDLIKHVLECPVYTNQHTSRSTLHNDLMKIEERRGWSDRFQAFALKFTQHEWDTVLVTWGWFIALLTEFHTLFIDFIILKSTAKRIYSRRSKWAKCQLLHWMSPTQNTCKPDSLATFMNVKMVMPKPTAFT